MQAFPRLVTGGGKNSVKSIPTFLILGCHILYENGETFPESAAELFYGEKRRTKIILDADMSTMENGVD